MGLDMYAYSIQADLIGDEQVDIEAGEIALNAIGFHPATDEELSRMTDEQRKTYWQNRDAAMLKMQADGIYNGDFAYWRKFNHLHGWMEQLYRKKGGTAESFNCVSVRLNPEDLDRLESMAAIKALPPTEGFFFGSTKPFSDEDKQEVLDFVKKARNAINDGKAVLYSSWW